MCNTISVRNSGPVGCKVRWRGVCMVNETLDMVGEFSVCLEIQFIQ